MSRSPHRSGIGSAPLGLTWAFTFPSRRARDRLTLRRPGLGTWQATPGTLWYYWPRYARLVAFDTSSRRPIGSLGPDGFSSGLSERGARFDYPPGDIPWASRTLRAGASVYQVHIEKRAATLLFTTDAGDPIGASLDIVPDFGWKYTALATRRFVYLVSSDGKLVWKSPYQPAYPDYDEIKICLLDPPDQYALWLSASTRFELQSGRKEPPQVTWFSGARSIKSMQLPVLPGNPPGLDPTGKAALLLMPPGLAAMMPHIMDDPVLTHERLWPYPVLAALLCVPVGWWLGRRYRFRLEVPGRVGRLPSALWRPRPAGLAECAGMAGAGAVPELPPAPRSHSSPVRALRRRLPASGAAWNRDLRTHERAPLSRSPRTRISPLSRSLSRSWAARSCVVLSARRIGLPRTRNRAKYIPDDNQRREGWLSG